jgi:hypothetical protein
MSKAMNHQDTLSRREFLKLGFAALGGLAFQPKLVWQQLVQEWPDAERLGRVTSGRVSIWSKPSAESQQLKTIYDDHIVIWLREVVGEPPGLTLSRRWVETPEGYIYAPRLQPVRYLPNPPVSELPTGPLGRGMWAEVTVPYLDVTLHNPPARAPWLKEAQFPRLYYSQIFWIDDLRTGSDGQVYYRVTQKYGYGDILWAPAFGFRPLTREELEPIHPDAEDKRIVVNLNYQMLSCYEGNREVYTCRISSGAKFDKDGNPTDKWSTPVGTMPTWRKLISHHMSGGVSGSGWDLPGIAWTILFSGNGEAIHSTFWHNDFGTPRSRGCINAAPDDAKWIFRWSEPHIPYDVGEMTISMPGGTKVQVIG